MIITKTTIEFNNLTKSLTNINDTPSAVIYPLNGVIEEPDLDVIRKLYKTGCNVAKKTLEMINFKQ